MKTFLEYLAEGKKRKPQPKYKGTPVPSDTHGSNSRDKAKKYKGTAVDSETHGSNSRKKQIDEKEERPLRSRGLPKPGPYPTHEHWVNMNDNSHLGDGINDVHYHLHTSHPYHHIPHQGAVSEYTQGSNELNHSLLAHYKEGKEHPRKHGFHDTHHLDQAIGHHELKHDLHVYSGVGFHPGHEAHKDPENKIHLPAYTSTSINKHTALNFAHTHEGHAHPYLHGAAHHILHVHLKPGQKGLYVGQHSGYQNEHEFVLPRNTTLKIHPKPSIVPGKYGVTPIHVWHAHVADNEEDHRQLKLPFKKP